MHLTQGTSGRPTHNQHPTMWWFLARARVCFTSLMCKVHVVGRAGQGRGPAQPRRHARQRQASTSTTKCCAHHHLGFLRGPNGFPHFSIFPPLLVCLPTCQRGATLTTIDIYTMVLSPPHSTSLTIVYDRWGVVLLRDLNGRKGGVFLTILADMFALRQGRHQAKRRQGCQLVQASATYLPVLGLA